MITILIFLGLLAVLVLVHELGHFQVARWFKITVEEFGFGFPPRAWSKVKNGIVYSLNWIPLGGFVKIKGEDGSVQEPDSFAAQPFYKKAAVLAAGVGMNIILGWFLLSFGLSIGLPGAIDDSAAATSKNIQIQIMQVLPKSAAAEAGLKMGDVVNSIDGEVFKTPDEYVKYIKSHTEKSLAISVKRHDQVQVINATPKELAGNSGKILGIQLVSTGLIKYPWYQAPWEGLKLTGFILLQIVLGLWHLLVSLFHGQGAGVGLAGPVGVAVMTGQMADLGFRYLLQFTALLSLNLAVVNFLPIPALDGGRLLFVLIEKLRRKPNRASLENMIHQIGFIVLLVLVGLVTFKDVALYAGSWFDHIKQLF